jgi:hypothetical protein
MAVQEKWRWCKKCQGLAYGGLGLGPCPAGGKHNHMDSWNYSLMHDTSSAEGQSDWRWCKKCQGLAYGGGSSLGPCPAGGEHDKGGWNYTLMYKKGHPIDDP